MSNNHKLMKITNDPEIKKMLSNNSEKLITMIDRSVAGVEQQLLLIFKWSTLLCTYAIIGYEHNAVPELWSSPILQNLFCKVIHVGQIYILCLTNSGLSWCMCFEGGFGAPQLQETVSQTHSVKMCSDFVVSCSESEVADLFVSA